MNNKGFAITTILYGTFLLFMMLLLAMLGILASYKNKMDILIENNNGARDIVDIYDKDSYLMTIQEGPLGEARKYYKAYDGSAIIAYVYDGAYTGPLLVSTDPDAVAYYTSHDSSIFYYDGTVVHNGSTYYYSSSEYWMSGNRTASGPYSWPKYENMTAEEATKKILEYKVKYHINDKNDNIEIAT